MAVLAISFSKSLLEKLRASLLTAFKLKNIQAYRLATALICYGEGRGIKEIAHTVWNKRQNCRQLAIKIHVWRNRLGNG